MNSTRFFLVVAAGAGVLFSSARWAGAQQVRDERQVKATYLYEFGRHVTWPKEPAAVAGNTFVIGVLGPNPFGPFLGALKTKQVQAKKVEVREFAAAKNYQPCHILMISSVVTDSPTEGTPAQRLAAFLKIKPAGEPVLIVSDDVGLAKDGAMINYSVDADGVVNLEINRRTVRNAKLDIDARLLNLSIVQFVD